MSREEATRQSQYLVARTEGRGWCRKTGRGVSGQEELSVSGSVTTTVPWQGSPARAVRACSCRIKAQKQRQCRWRSGKQHAEPQPQLFPYSH